MQTSRKYGIIHAEGCDVMPKTKDEIREYKRTWEKESCMKILLKIPLTSSIPDALKVMQYESGTTPTTYTRIALEEKLQRDGYLET